MNRGHLRNNKQRQRDRQRRQCTRKIMRRQTQLASMRRQRAFITRCMRNRMRPGQPLGEGDDGNQQVMTELLQNKSRTLVQEKTCWILRLTDDGSVTHFRLLTKPPSDWGLCFL